MVAGDGFVEGCRFGCRCRLFGASKWAENARLKASLCQDESCNDNKRDYKYIEAASEGVEREHRRGFEHMLGASMDVIVNDDAAFCRWYHFLLVISGLQISRPPLDPCSPAVHVWLASGANHDYVGRGILWRGSLQRLLNDVIILVFKI